MKKYLLTIILLSLGCLLTMGQSVMGIPLGSSYEDTFSALEKRFGYINVHKKNGNLQLYDFYMGDLMFKFGTFFFQYNGNRSYFNAASFSIPYEKKDLDAAKAVREILYNLLKDKYENEYLEEFKNEQGFKCYKFGLNPIDNTKVLGIISIDRANGNDGIERYYLNLDYLPIHYLDKTSDF